MSLSDQSWNYVAATGNGTPDSYTTHTYSEKIGSGVITSSPGSNGVERVFYCAWAEHVLFMDALLGYAQTDTDSSGVTTITRPSLPDQHPLYSNLFALDATVKPYGQDSATPANNISTNSHGKYANYKVAEITAMYRPVDFDIVKDGMIDSELDRFVSRYPAFGGESITINSAGMFFASASPAKPLNYSPTRPTMTMEFTYVWRWVPVKSESSRFIVPNMTGIKTCYGKVNDDVFDNQGYNFPKGTLLFLGVDPHWTNYRVCTGANFLSVYWEIAFKFLYRDNGLISRSANGGSISEHAGHNFIWDQGGNWWDLITSDGTVSGNRLIPSADFDTLFVLD